MVFQNVIIFKIISFFREYFHVFLIILHILSIKWFHVDPYMSVFPKSFFYFAFYS